MDSSPIATMVADLSQSSPSELRVVGDCDPFEHEYLSTACQHETEDPDLHKLCRRTCKWCRSACTCPKHALENLEESV